jgi:hypothetical protein
MLRLSEAWYAVCIQTIKVVRMLQVTLLLCERPDTAVHSYS